MPQGADRHAGETSRQGPNAPPCEIDDDYRNRAVQGIINIYPNLCGGWEDPAPYTYDESSATDDDADYRRLAVSIRHLHK